MFLKMSRGELVDVKCMLGFKQVISRSILDKTGTERTLVFHIFYLLLAHFCAVLGTCKLTVFTCYTSSISHHS